MTLSALFQAVCWLLPPSGAKNRLLRLFGHQVAPSAVIFPTVVWKVGRFEIADEVHIGLLNVFRGLSLVVFEHGAAAGSWNWTSAHPVYQTLDPQAGTLVMRTWSKIGSRNYLDCSGTIDVGPFSHIGGVRCLLQTHQPDFVNSRQTVGRITVGHHSQVASNAMMIKGAHLPETSLLAAGSTMLPPKGNELKPGLYAGTPAVWRRATTGKWFERDVEWMHEHVIEGPMGRSPDGARQAKPLDRP
ncbi:hypothetical protein LV457_12750 [Mycobacterium sp. MYCO198283]|uniref:hypothetical protein n=1 Tax=Mycobacterium sp. MYCO198283 TaxID=2883505 RepID=UPI001E4D1933|nr:hypothetical protein [Mycobacterium sp. MYCO198283]MCG5433146.1 hypothetical protein [Mycobacterium sp. MYCO198283]